jgi:DNA polymerase-3 subunit epsilon/exodeoxyribonuclease X
VRQLAPPPSPTSSRNSPAVWRTFIVGHNVGVDWHLLHRRCPSIRPAGLIDTLRLARPDEKGNNLARLLDCHQLTPKVTELARDSQPHRALWDTTGAALLLQALSPTRCRTVRR